MNILRHRLLALFLLLVTTVSLQAQIPDGIFSSDPNQYPDAVIMERIESPTDP